MLRKLPKKLLSLPIDDRSYIVERLMASLEKGEDLQGGTGFKEDLDLSSEWINEIHDRVKDFEEGRVELLDSDSVVRNTREKLRQKYTNRTAS